MTTRTHGNGQRALAIDAAAFNVAAYPNAYVWYVFVAALDIILTHFIIFRLGGIEVNAIAQRAIDAFGLWGLIGLKFVTVLVVIAICQALAQQKPDVGRRLAEWAVAISSVPIVFGLLQIVLALTTGALPIRGA